MVCIITLAFIVAVSAISGAGYYFYVTKSVTLDETKLDSLSSSSLEIYDINNLSIKPSSENYTDIDKLKSHTKKAFISAEDKRFYSHNGIDYIRIGGALISNIKTKSFSQGASTISQQLIKNTQLSSEKTISRKLKEFKLTKTLEDKYSKDEILELYLNNIYFGNGCYGIENASLHYFSKNAKDLTLAESAILAGTINAPSIYDIESNPEKANARKNLILNLMQSYGHISKEECEKAKKENINLNISKLFNNNFIYNEIIKEASSNLKVTENLLKSQNLKIYTHINLKLQSKINNQIKNNYSNLDSSPKIASIIIDNETNGIVAVCGSKSTFESRRQPGSAIKPILVYAPAIENDIISPSTKIIDEKINISGYSPENADKKYHGSMSAKTALSNSYNIPAVKILNEIGISNAQNFAKKLGINFDENDNNLAIALGGFTNGTTLFELIDAYTTFANNGKYNTSKYIKKIIKNNQVIYSNNSSENQTQVMKESTAYLITDMLKETTKTGTAKRLKNFSFEIASKTGTVGLSNSKKNSDAYNISYTNSHTILTYFGGTKMPENINGSTYPTMLAKDIFNNLYQKQTPQKFTKPKSVVQKAISLNGYNDGKIVLADETEKSINEYFSITNQPAENESQNYKIDIINLENKQPIITFKINDNTDYKIFRSDLENDKLLIFDSTIDSLNNNNSNDKLNDELNNKNMLFSKEEKISNNLFKKLFSKKINNTKNAEIKNNITETNSQNSQLITISYTDKSAETGKIYEYYVEFYDKITKKYIKSQKIKLKTY